MKRLNIAVELKDNEVFLESVQEAVQGQAKQFAREQVAEVLKEEVERITDARIKELKSNAYFNSIRDNIVARLSEKLQKSMVLPTDLLDTVIQTKVNEYMDKKIAAYGGLDAFINDYLDQSIAAALLERTGRGDQ